MAIAVRVLPALIAVSIGALAFKGVDLAQALAEATEEARTETATAEGEAAPAEGEPSSEHADGQEEAPPAGAAASGPKADSCIPSLDYAAETGISAQEMLVLRSLSDRRQQLDERENAIETREQSAAAAEVRLNDQIGELKKLETDVQKLLTDLNAKRDERMAALVKTYETMKPAQAATIFNTMDDKVLVDLAKGMKPAVLAPILAAMEAKRAEALTRMLAALSQGPAPGTQAFSSPPPASPG